MFRQTIKCVIILLSYTLIACQSADVRQLAVEPTGDSALYDHVSYLTSTPDPRNYENMASLNIAADYIAKQFQELALEVQPQPFIVEGNEYRNVVARLGPVDSAMIVIGAHYDVAGNQPGADDNASGVAGLIELARMLKADEQRLKNRIELVAYSLEEPPFFRTQNMGSYVHAKSLHTAGVNPAAMISLEMIGYFSDAVGSQKYPDPLPAHLYPQTGNFIAAVSNEASAALPQTYKKALEATTDLACVALAAPASVTGVDFSDHLNYWHFGFPAMMITDTAFMRNANYHEPTDTIETLDFVKMKMVVVGLANMILAGGI